MSRTSARPFDDREDLYARWVEASRTHPDLKPFLDDVADYVTRLKFDLDQLRQAVKPLNGAPPSPGPSKKRKLNDGSALQELAEARPTVEVPDVSFSVPVRKKLRVEVMSSTESELGIVARNQSTGEAEAGILFAAVEMVAVVPVPEKAQAQFNFVVVPNSAPADALVWSVPPALVDTLRRAVNAGLQAAGRSDAVVEPDAQEFVSNAVQAHRKEEKAFHVKAWKGSKDGFLYLLPNGILFGFRKPVLFFPFSSIASISYTSVLQRTFNLVISTTSDNGANSEEIEFAMLDQVDFPPLDAYVKRHKLHDASLAASRRAQKKEGQAPTAAAAAQGAPARGANGHSEGQDGEEEESELAKAERELQDREDEEEEDYDPESEDSGGESEEEGYGEGGEDDMEAEGDAEAEENYDEMEGDED